MFLSVDFVAYLLACIQVFERKTVKPSNCNLIIEEMREKEVDKKTIFYRTTRDNIVWHLNHLKGCIIALEKDQNVNQKGFEALDTCSRIYPLRNIHLTSRDLKTVEYSIASGSTETPVCLFFILLRVLLSNFSVSKFHQPIQNHAHF